MLLYFIIITSNEQHFEREQCSVSWLAGCVSLAVCLMMLAFCAGNEVVPVQTPSKAHQPKICGTAR